MVTIGIFVVAVTLLKIAKMREKALGWSSSGGWELLSYLWALLSGSVIIIMLGTAFSAGEESYTASINGVNYYCVRSTFEQDVSYAWPGASATKYNYAPGSETCWELED